MSGRIEAAAFDETRLPERGVTVLEASAGTGKTYAITSLVTHLVARGASELPRLLVVTFTRLAAAELRVRIRGRLRAALCALEDGRAPEGDRLLRSLLETLDEGGRRQAADRLRAALRDFDLATISTIHGFCDRVLRDHAFEIGMPFDAEAVDGSDELGRAAREEWLRRLLTHGEERLARWREEGWSFETLLRLAGAVASDPDLLPEDDDVVEERAREVAARLAALARDLERWREHEAVRSRFDQENPPFKKGFSAAAYDAGREALLRWAEREEPDLRSLPTEVGVLSPDSVREGLDKRRKDRPAVPEGPLARAVEEAERLCRRAVACDVARWARDVLARLDRRAEERSLRTYDEMLRRVRDALRREPAAASLAETLRGAFDAVLVDEFQDTDGVQWEIFERVFAGGGHRLVLIGDPKQAIYRFRGADVYVYLRATGAAAGGAPRRRYVLDTNWRSDRSLVAALDHLFRGRWRGGGTPFIDERIGVPRVDAAHDDRLFRGGEPASGVRLRWFTADEPETRRRNGKVKRPNLGSFSLPDAVVAEVRALLAEGLEIEGREPAAVGCGDVAVLVKSNRTAREVVEALNERGLPAVLHATSSVYATAEAEELRRLLEAVLAPYRADLVRGALATSAVGLDAADLDRMERAGAPSFDERVEAFAGAGERWRAAGVAAAVRRLFDAFEILPGLLARTGGERKATNLLHLAELLQRVAVEQGLGPAETLAHLAARVAEADEDAAPAAEETQPRLESDERAVQVITVHRSKGLEFPVVVCPDAFRWKGNPSRRRPFAVVHDEEGRARLHLGRSAVEEVSGGRDEEEEQERMRLLYVALTRARHLLVLFCGSFNEVEESPLSHLLMGPGRGGEGAPPGAVRERLERVPGDEWRAELQEVAREAPGRIEVTDPPPEPDETPHAGGAETLPTPRPARFERVLDTLFRTTSYSGVVRGRDERDGLEALLERADPAPADDGEEPASASTRVPLADFPAGPRPGICLHEILERAPWEEDERGGFARHAEASLRRWGLPVEHADVVTAALQGVLDHPLDEDATLRLRDVPRGARLHEMRFLVPVAHQRRAVAVRRIADAIEAAASPPFDADLAREVRALPAGDLRGFLTGSVDLVFLDGAGRLRVVDYKSNHLGPTSAHYAPEALEREMLRHLYPLQALFYALAVRRFARRRGVAPGPVHYLFLRAAAPGVPPGAGVVTFDPPASLLDRLDRLFADGEEAP